ncbi:hypothetical protein D3C76_89700 [compost metagenome]
MPMTLDDVIIEFRELVKVYPEVAKDPSKVTRDLRARIGKMVDEMAMFAVGWNRDALTGLSMDLTIETMRCVRSDVYNRLQAEGINYSHHVQNGRIAVCLSDQASGATMSAPMTDLFEHTTLQRLSMERMMDWVSLH